MGLFKKITERVKRITKGNSKTKKVSPPAPPSMTSSKRSTSRNVTVPKSIKKELSKRAASRSRTMKTSRSKKRTSVPTANLLNLNGLPPAPPSMTRKNVFNNTLPVHNVVFDPFKNSSSNMTASQAKRAFPNSPFAQNQFKKQALNNAYNGNAELKKVTQQEAHNLAIELNKKEVSKESIEKALINIFTTAAQVHRIPYPK